jgi:tyrosinase
VVDIVNQLKYTYDPSDISHASNSQPQAQIVRITGINRATIQGSFLIVVRAEIDGVERVVGTESVLSRWKVSGCANCQTHLNVKAFVPLVALDEKALSTVKVGLHMREKRIDDINNTPMGRGWRLGNLKPMEALQN